MICSVHDLQIAGVMVDTRLILDDGELSIHWPLLDLYGDQQWWSGLGKAGGDNVIILPGVTVSEAQQFVDILYGVRKVLSSKHFTVIEDTAVTEEFVCNNNSDCEDIKLEPYEIYTKLNANIVEKSLTIRRASPNMSSIPTD